ncbi:MAG: hypothetical protein HYX27_07295 [Acidobacteria bacterium]|nr:hypothetical protein [Acidobacteriota bacterium]
MKIAHSKVTIPGTGKRVRMRGARLGHEVHTETLAAPAWRLPGGVRLAEYALRGGFVASSLLARGERHR